MIVWIKEFTNVLSVDKVRLYFKPNIPVLPLTSYEIVKYNDVVITSKLDNSNLSIIFNNRQILIFEDVIQTLLTNALQEIEHNYDYYYLKNAITSAKQPSTETLITGSSYALFGIDEQLLNNEVNCSLSSLDIYYSIKTAHEICSQNPNIKNIVLCCGYYCLFSDLSKTTTPGEITRVTKVYYPLFNDLHNCIFLPPKTNILYESSLFDVSNVTEIVALSEYHKHYFNKERPRSKFAMKFKPEISPSWAELSNEEKKEFGYSRALSHNKSIQHRLSFDENVDLINNFAQYCFNNNIKLIFVVTPTTPYYQTHLDTKFKEIFYDTLNNLIYPIHVLDFFDDVSYCDEDFIDTDHLGDPGAAKMTKHILDMLYAIDNEL